MVDFLFFGVAAVHFKDTWSEALVRRRWRPVVLLHLTATLCCCVGMCMYGVALIAGRVTSDDPARHSILGVLPADGVLFIGVTCFFVF